MNFDLPYDYREDIEEIDKAMEAQKIWLEKQYEERKKHVEEKEKEKQNLNSSLNRNILSTIEEKAKQNAQIFLLDKYMTCYNAEIKNNEILGKCSLHYILGGFLRDKKIYKSPYMWLDYRVHLILFQMSGTGKGMTANFVSRIIKEIKFPLLDSKDKLLKQDKWRNPEIMKSGKKTKESFLNDFVKEKGELKRDKNGVPIIRKGSLEVKDYIIYEEGGTLFDNTKESIELTDNFLIAMESIGSSNNEIEKDLVVFETSLKTKSKSSIFIMTRPIGKIKQQVAQSGFFQRCLFIPKEISMEEINEMRINSMLDDLDFMCGNYDKKNYEYYNDMIGEFIKIIQFAYENEIVPNEKKRDDIKLFMKEKMDWFYKDLLNNSINKNYEDIICSLQNRYKDNMYKIAYHSACMRFSKIVDLEDFQYAFDIIQELYLEQKKWLFDSVEIDREDVKANADFKRTLLNIIKLDKNRMKTFDMIAKEISVLYEMDLELCKKKITKLSEGVMSIIKIEQPIIETSKISIK